MTDKTIPADKVRAILNGPGSDPDKIQALHDMFPPRPTLADMTEEELRDCQWMQCDVETWGRAVIVLPNERGGRTVTLNRRGHMAYEDHTDVTPRPDLPRLEWPGNEKPAPALPEGWRLADHKKHGRVLVVRVSGDTAIYATPFEALGICTRPALMSDLTFVDTDNQTTEEA